MLLKKEYTTLVQSPSKQGKNFPLMHRQIMMLKAWLRGIHHHCDHLQQYLDEFCFRSNRNRNMQTIFHELISKMVFSKPMAYKNFQLLWSS